MIPVTGLAQLVRRISSVHVENFSSADRDETLYADHEHENINSWFSQQKFWKLYYLYLFNIKKSF